jgi:rubredoxin
MWHKRPDKKWEDQTTNWKTRKQLGKPGNKWEDLKKNRKTLQQMGRPDNSGPVHYGSMTNSASKAISSVVQKYN